MGENRMSAKKRRLAVNTGGGDCPGLNAVIRAVVKRCVLQLEWEVIGIRDSFDGLIGPRMDIVELTPDVVAGGLTRGGTLLGSTNRGNPFDFDPTGQGQGQDLSELVVERLHSLGCDGLIALGGDGTMAICNDLSKRTGLKVIGVPKTIDNDLLGTDITFGFNSAVEFATLAVDRLHTTAESHHRVMVVEVMGRNAGFIALHAGVGGGADAILIPEVPFELSKVAEKILDRQLRGRHFSIVVVAEGAREKGGEQIHDGLAASGKTRLGGIGRYVADKLHRTTGIDARYTVLGHLQRGGIPTAFDRILATRLGNHAVDLAVDDLWNRLVVMRANKITDIPLADAVDATKSVSLDCDLVRAARGVGIVFGD